MAADSNRSVRRHGNRPSLDENAERIFAILLGVEPRQEDGERTGLNMTDLYACAESLNRQGIQDFDDVAADAYLATLEAKARIASDPKLPTFVGSYAAGIVGNKVARHKRQQADKSMNADIANLPAKIAPFHAANLLELVSGKEHRALLQDALAIVLPRMVDQSRKIVDAWLAIGQDQKQLKDRLAKDLQCSKKTAERKISKAIHLLEELLIIEVNTIRLRRQSERAEAFKNAEERRRMQKNAEERRRTQKNAEECIRMQKNAEERRRTQKNAEERRRTQKNAEERRRTQKNADPILSRPRLFRETTTKSRNLSLASASRHKQVEFNLARRPRPAISELQRRLNMETQPLCSNQSSRSSRISTWKWPPTTALHGWRS